MHTTGRSQGDGVLAATVALATNALVVWQLQALLAPPPDAALDDAAAALQVVWIGPVPRPAAVAVAPIRQQTEKAGTSPAIARSHEARARPDLPASEAPADLTSTRPMTAVYLQQTRQWARQQGAVQFVGSDALADRAGDLPGRGATRFRVAEPLSAADVVDAIGKAFGNGPHPCIRNRQDVAAYATGRDALALEMALDIERQCRP